MITIALVWIEAKYQNIKPEWLYVGTVIIDLNLIEAFLK